MFSYRRFFLTEGQTESADINTSAPYDPQSSAAFLLDSGFIDEAAAEPLLID